MVGRRNHHRTPRAGPPPPETSLYELAAAAAVVAAEDVAEHGNVRSPRMTSPPPSTTRHRSRLLGFFRLDVEDSAFPESQQAKLERWADEIAAQRVNADDVARIAFSTMHFRHLQARLRSMECMTDERLRVDFHAILQSELRHNREVRSIEMNANKVARAALHSPQSVAELELVDDEQEEERPAVFAEGPSMTVTIV